MNKLTTLIVAIILLSTLTSAVIPYYQDFENNITGWGNSTSASSTVNISRVTGNPPAFAGSWGGNTTSNQFDEAVYRAYASNVNPANSGNIVNVTTMYYSTALQCGQVAVSQNTSNVTGVIWTDECFGVNGGRLDVNINNTDQSTAGNASCAALPNNLWYNVTVGIANFNTTHRRAYFQVRNSTNGAIICDYGRTDNTLATSGTGWTIWLSSGSGGDTKDGFDNTYIEEFQAPSSTISFVNPTPSNSGALLEGSILTVNTTSTSFTGFEVNTTHYLYNSTGTLVGQNNGTNQSNYTSTFTGLMAGTYLINATATNGTFTNQTETRTVYVYNLTKANITNPQNNTDTNAQFLNITWQNATPYPVVAVNITGFDVALLNSDGSLNKTLTSTSQLFYNWNIYNDNLQTGQYYIRVTANTSNNTQVTNQHRINITTNAQVNITVKDFLNNNTINNFTIYIEDENTSTSQTINTTTGNILAQIIKGNLYNFSITSQGYARNNHTNNTWTQTLNNFTSYLYITNSISIIIVDEITGVLITNTTVNITFSSTNASYEYNTTTGTLFTSNLTEGFYQVIFMANGYSTRSYFLTILDQTTQTLTARLSPSYVIIGTYVRDGSEEPILNALFTLQRQINGSYTTTAQGLTDAIGYIQFNLVEGYKYKGIISATNYTTREFYFEPYAANQPYIFRLELSDTSIYDDFNEFIQYYYTPTSNQLNSTVTNFTFTTISRNGGMGSNTILWTAINCTGSYTNTSGSPSGTSVTQTRNLTNYLGGLTCTYAFQVDGFNGVYITVHYNVANYTINNATLTTAIEDFKTETNDSVWTGLVAMFVVITLSFLAFELSKGDPIPTTIVAFMAEIAFAFFGYLNPGMVAIISLIAGLLFYTDRTGY